MTWDEMIADLRKSGVREYLLPVRGSDEGCLGLREQDSRFVVSVTERAETEDLAEFPTKESAVGFIYDSMMFHFRLNGDTRLDQWNANPKTVPLPQAEDFGGRTLRR